MVLEKREFAEVCYAAKSAIDAIKRGDHVQAIELSRVSDGLKDVAKFIQKSIAEEFK